MRHARIPTSAENVGARLFLRYFSVYAVAALVAFLLIGPALPRLLFDRIGAVEWLFVPLALLGGLLIVATPYLSLLVIAKACYDAALFYRVTRLARIGAIGFLPWNACFCLLAFSLVLTGIAAAHACRFAHESGRRDTALLFSRPFLRYFLEALVLCALASALYLLWSNLSDLLSPAF